MTVTAPFTPEQVENLNRYQRSGDCHPFTCGGNRGDARYLREGVSELRKDYGPGYRVYYAEQGEVVVILLAGGTKKSQGSDIETAIAMLRDIQEVQ